MPLQCKKMNTKNIQPIMDNLSIFRTETLIPPFINIGADLFGTLYIKHMLLALKRLTICMLEYNKSSTEKLSIG